MPAAGFALTLAWLAACVAYDLKRRTVPMPLTIGPLALALGWRALAGDWESAVLAAALFPIAELPRAWRLPAGVGAAGAAWSLSGHDPGVASRVAVILFVWAVWEVGTWGTRVRLGGADAQIVMALVLATGRGDVFAWIAVAGGAAGAIALWRKRPTLPYTPPIAVGTAAWWLAIGQFL